MLLLALGPRSACDRTSDEEECLSRHWATMGEWTVSDLGFGFRNGAAKAGSLRALLESWDASRRRPRTAGRWDRRLSSSSREAWLVGSLETESNERGGTEVSEH